MTTHSKEFDADWPQVLDEMSVYLQDTLPTAGASPRVTLELSEKLAPKNQTRPHLDDWLNEWRGQGITILHNFAPASRHTLRIKAGKKSGFWRGFLEALGVPVKEADPQQESTEQTNKPPSAQGSGAFKLVEEAIGNAILHFLQNEGAAQRQFMPNHTYVLKSVELHPLTQAADTLLNRLFEMPVALRQNMLQQQLDKQLRRYPANLAADRQCQLLRMSAENHTQDAIVEATERAAGNAYLVFLLGDYWEQQQPQPPKVAAPPAHTLHVEVFDRNGPAQAVELDGTDIVIGREGQLRVDGEFASRRHCQLRISNGCATLEDLQSTHGTYLNGQRLAPNSPQPVSGTLDIRLGSAAVSGTDYADYPRIRVKLPSPSQQPGGITPFAKPQPATPIVGPSRAAPAPKLAELYIQDHSGKRVLAVHKIPFTIGRDKDCDAAIDEANTGTPRRHLTLKAVSDQGATVDISGGNGTALAGTPVNQGERLWPWDATMELAIDTKSDYPTPTILLKRPG